MAKLTIAVCLLLLVAGAAAQPKRSPAPEAEASPAPETPAEPAKEPAKEPAPAGEAPAGGDAEATKAIVADAIQRARPAIRGRDNNRILDAMKPALSKVAEAKAAGVPVQTAVAQSVTDVQERVPRLSSQSRQAVLDAAYRVYTASPAASPSPSPEASPEPSPSPEPAAEANATAPEAPLVADNATEPAANATEPAANATAPEAPLEANATEANATAATAAPAKAAAPAKSGAAAVGTVVGSVFAVAAAALLL